MRVAGLYLCVCTTRTASVNHFALSGTTRTESVNHFPLSCATRRESVNHFPLSGTTRTAAPSLRGYNRCSSQTDSPPVVTAVTPAVAVDCQPYCIEVSPLVQSVLGSTPTHCCLKIMHTLDSCSLAGPCGAGTFYLSLLARQAVRAVNTICQLWHCC